MCPKCRGDMFDWQYITTGRHMEGMDRCPETFGDTGEHLDLTCKRCLYTIGMETAGEQ